MRYAVELVLSKENVPKDKNRMILSFLKHIYESYDEEYYKSLYKEDLSKQKSFTFSLYMRNCKFTKDEIIVPDKRLLLNFSTADMKDGIYFYNAILANRRKTYVYKDNSLTIARINMVKEKIITNDYGIFSAMSPIIIREHTGINADTWYHSFNDEKGRRIFKENLKHQLIDYFGEERRLDIEEVKIKVLANKEVKVKDYDIVILSNICKLKIIAKAYILDYIYKSGIGSRRSSGFGMVDLL